MISAVPTVCPALTGDFATPESWLTPNELARICAVFSSLGVNHIRLTGGEPLVRPELNEIVARLHAVPGIEDLSLSTNASRLGKFAPDLKSSGDHPPEHQPRFICTPPPSNS